MQLLAHYDCWNARRLAVEDGTPSRTPAAATTDVKVMLTVLVFTVHTERAINIWLIAKRTAHTLGLCVLVDWKQLRKELCLQVRAIDGRQQMLKLTVRKRTALQQ